APGRLASQPPSAQRELPRRRRYGPPDPLRRIALAVGRPPRATRATEPRSRQRPRWPDRETAVLSRSAVQLLIQALGSCARSLLPALRGRKRPRIRCPASGCFLPPSPNRLPWSG